MAYCRLSISTSRDWLWEKLLTRVVVDWASAGRGSSRFTTATTAAISNANATLTPTAVGRALATARVSRRGWGARDVRYSAAEAARAIRSSSRNGERRREVVMTYLRLAEAKNRGAFVLGRRARQSPARPAASLRPPSHLNGPIGRAPYESLPRTGLVKLKYHLAMNVQWKKRLFSMAVW